jgi:hypothetical protein
MAIHPVVLKTPPRPAGGSLFCLDRLRFLKKTPSIAKSEFWFSRHHRLRQPSSPMAVAGLAEVGTDFLTLRAETSSFKPFAAFRLADSDCCSFFAGLKPSPSYLPTICIGFIHGSPDGRSPFGFRISTANRICKGFSLPAGNDLRIDVDKQPQSQKRLRLAGNALSDNVVKTDNCKWFQNSRSGQQALLF